MSQAFQDGDDIHRRTAAELFGLAPEAVTPDLLRIAKVVNFGMIYGMGAERLARETGMAYGEALWTSSRCTSRSIPR